MDDESTPVTPPTASPEIQYEETPILTPVVENSTPDEPIVETPQQPIPEYQDEPVETETPVTPPKKRSMRSIIKGLIIFVVLFIVGYALSGVIRSVITTSSEKKIATPTKTPTPTTAMITSLDTIATDSSVVPLATPKITTTPTPQASESAWKQYNPVHGTTRTPITTIQLSIPSSILAPICDGTSCGSQGTYLPGGTRLTIAPRGTGEVLADYRGKVISDAAGKALITKETTIGGKKATEYTTDTTGSTVGGYSFTTMHGYMIEVTDTLSFEINHFSPSGIKTDFAADDAIFKSIVATLLFK